MTPFLVCKFEKSSLSNLVKECFGADFPDILQKKQIDYVFHYLSALESGSILLESEYIDKDYIEDYSRYYLRRFSGGGHKCARLHFFKGEVNHRSIDKLLAEGNEAEIAELQRSYLGFMVVKPLPRTFIGRTCLKHYDRINDNEGRRVLAREYTVNLFGIKLTVNSIAFQEQDKVVSACAATAIWTSLQALSWRSTRAVPSCSEITANAINFIDGSSNSFPSRELSNKQILRALDVEGLRYHAEKLNNATQAEVIEAVKWHVDSGLPSILGVKVFGKDESGTWKEKAGHAVTIVGYKLLDASPGLYIHDDRFGPYARAKFVALEGEFAIDVQQRWAMVLQERDAEGNWEAAHEVLVPETLITPMQKKAHLPVSFAINTSKTIADAIRLIFERIPAPDGYEGTPVTYTIKLEEISDIKAKITRAEMARFVERDGRELSCTANQCEQWVREKVAFLSCNFARLQWVATFRFYSQPFFTMLIDATDIPQGNAVSAIYRDSPALCEPALKALSECSVPSDNDNKAFFASFIKKLQAPTKGLFEHLDQNFGSPRAPFYLKGPEYQGGNIGQNDTVRTFYDATTVGLEALFPGAATPGSATLIWAIAYDGALLVGIESDGMGHPCLTGFKPARIAGELQRTMAGWEINSKSGRYRADYSNKVILLENALARLKSIFVVSAASLSIQDGYGQTAASQV